MKALNGVRLRRLVKLCFFSTSMLVAISAPALAQSSIAPIIGLNCVFGLWEAPTDYVVGRHPDGTYVIRRRFFRRQTGNKAAWGNWEAYKSFKVEGDWIYFWEKSEEKYIGMNKVESKRATKIDIKNGMVATILVTNGRFGEWSSNQCNFDPKLMQPFQLVK
jgi:hypothetical protein